MPAVVPGVVRPWLPLLAFAALACTGPVGERRPAPPSHEPASDSRLPDPAATLDDLYADDLTLGSAKDLSHGVYRLDLGRGGRTFRGKWKAVGRHGLEDRRGNNAPRCEVAAWRVNRLLFGARSADRHLVPPVAVRAFHRPGPRCTRACANLPRLPAAAATEPATFPEVNDHLVLGAMTYWIDDVDHVFRMNEVFWSVAHFAGNRHYRRSVSDLFLFLAVIAHGDANYPKNFLFTPERDRVYSIDNGRSFDGVANRRDRVERGAWNELAKLGPDYLIAPAFSRETAGRLRALDRDGLARELRVAAAVDLATGRSVREPADDPDLRALVARPLADEIGLTLHERGVWTGTVAGAPWVLFGISEPGIDDVLDRAQRIAARLGSPGGPALFEP